MMGKTRGRVRCKKFQTLAEVSILLSVVVAVLAGMQVYLKRGLQARHKTSVDAAVSMAQKVAGAEDSGLLQYEPYYQDQEQKTTARQLNLEKIETTEDQERKLHLKKYSSQNIESSSGLGIDFEEDDHWEKPE